MRASAGGSASRSVSFYVGCLVGERGGIQWDKVGQGSQ